jgi:hypothetical protein
MLNFIESLGAATDGSCESYTDVAIQRRELRADEACTYELRRKTRDQPMALGALTVSVQSPARRCLRLGQCSQRLSHRQRHPVIGTAHALQVRQRRLQRGTRLREFLARGKTLSLRGQRFGMGTSRKSGRRVPSPSASTCTLRAGQIVGACALAILSWNVARRLGVRSGQTRLRVVESCAA